MISITWWMKTLLLILFLSPARSFAARYATAASARSAALSPQDTLVLFQSRNFNENDEESEFDKMLDRQFFEPNEVGEESPFKWFADLVENDYDTAESLYAGGFLVFMVIVSQELFRMQIHGSSYVPFHSGGGAGGL
jgi:hypothetical protein